MLKYHEICEMELVLLFQSIKVWSNSLDPYRQWTFRRRLRASWRGLFMAQDVVLLKLTEKTCTRSWPIPSSTYLYNTGIGYRRYEGFEFRCIHHPIFFFFFSIKNNGDRIWSVVFKVQPWSTWYVEVLTPFPNVPRNRGKSLTGHPRNLQIPRLTHNAQSILSPSSGIRNPKVMILELAAVLEEQRHSPQWVRTLARSAVEDVMLLPPPNFGVVDRGIYRSGFPTADCLPFLEALKLRSIVWERLPLFLCLPVSFKVWTRFSINARRFSAGTCARIHTQRRMLSLSDHTGFASSSLGSKGAGYLPFPFFSLLQYQYNSNTLISNTRDLAYSCVRGLIYSMLRSNSRRMIWVCFLQLETPN